MAKPSVKSRIVNISKHRQQVLSQSWGQNLSPDEAGRFLAELPDARFPSTAYGRRGPTPLIQPRGGVPLFEGQRNLTQILDQAGADFIPLTIDSYTRHNQYDVASELLERSEEEEKNYLNGYPLICHGHKVTRGLYDGLEKPVSLRHGTPDARLLAEVALASGIVEIEGGSICYCLPYSERFPLDRSLLYWQYVDRICAIHSTPDRPVHRESFGPLTATMVPPAVVIVIQIIEALLAAEQGVKSFAVSFAQMGSMTQDIACARVLRKLARHYLDLFGFEDVPLHLVYHQWMGQFPADAPRAGALITASCQIATMIGADKIVVKTIDEALGVPDAEVNAEAVRCVRYVMDRLGCRDQITSPEIEKEVVLLESEVGTVLDAIFKLSGDLFWESVFRAFQAGMIDVPFAPHIDNANRLVTMRDLNGSIRIKDPGNLPITPEDLMAERRQLADRQKAPIESFHQLLSDINIMA